MITTLNTESLLTESRWLQRLARGLTHDESDAADLMQDTWLAVLRRGPRPDQPLRPWLATVLSNGLRMRRRAASRRVAREVAVGNEVRVEDTHDRVLERAELHRALVEMVVSLDEPYRRTVLLRFFEDLSAAEIARLDGVPAGTVRWRLKVGLDRLRSRLDERPGGRDAWMLALGQPRPPRALPLTLTAPALAALTAVVSLAVAFWLHQHAPVPSVPTASAATTVPAAHGAIATPRSAPFFAAYPAWYAPPGASPRHVAGTVLQDGHTSDGARVRLETWRTVGDGLAPLEVVSDANGHFDFGVVPPYKYSATAAIPGQTDAIVTFDLGNPRLNPASDQLRLVVTPCDARLFGVITDAAGAPVAGASVRRESAGAGVLSDSTGAYELCLPRGNNGLEFRATAFGGVYANVEIVGRTRRDVILTPEATVTGHVIRDDDGAPVPNATVMIWPALPGHESIAWATAIADETGTFHASGLQPGRYLVSAQGDRLTAHDVEVNARSGGTGNDVVLRTRPDVRVTGRVLRDGQPVPGVFISAVSRTGYGGGRGFTQEDGTFSLGAAPGGEISFEVVGADVVSPDSIAVGAAGRNDVVVEIAERSTVRGRVMAGGRPMAGARIRLCGGSRCVANTTSDDSGAFVVRGVGPGNYMVSADSDRLGASSREVAISVPARKDSDGIELSLTCTGVMSGRVVDEDGVAVPSAEIDLESGSAVSDVDGAFRLDGRCESNVAVRSVSRQDGLTIPLVNPTQRLEVGREQRVLVKNAHQMISGRVLTSDGEPAADARIQVVTSKEQFAEWQTFPRAISDADGHFEVHGLPDAEYAVTADAGDGGRGMLSQVRPGTSVTIVVEDTTGVEGRLVGFAHPATVRVHSLDRLSNKWQTAASNDASTFRLTGLAPGRYLVMAETPGEADVAVVELPHGPLTMTSHGTASLSGVVLDAAQRTPLTGYRCRAVARSGDWLAAAAWDEDTSAETGPDGRFVLQRVPAGELDVGCFVYEGARGGSGDTAITLAAGATGDVEVLASGSSNDVDAIGARFDWNRIVPVFDWVQAGGPAGAAGIQVGDRVLAVDGVSIVNRGLCNVMRMIDDHAPGSAVVLKVERRGNSLDLRVVRN